MDARTGAATPEPAQNPTSPSETTIDEAFNPKGRGILVDREARDARAAIDRERKVEEAKEIAEAELARQPLVPVSLFDPAEQEANNKFYRNFEILKLAAAYAAPNGAPALATEYKKWMDAQ